MWKMRRLTDLLGETVGQAADAISRRRPEPLSWADIVMLFGGLSSKSVSPPKGNLCDKIR